MTTETPKPPRVPPRWFIRTAWSVHRAMCTVSGGRWGLWPPRPGKWGALRLTAIGRKSGRRRTVILAYFEDGPNLALMAMNGWGEGHPAWFLNLQANPDVVVEVDGADRPMRARLAEGAEHVRLWSRWCELDSNLDAFARMRTTRTAVVVLEPAG